MRTEKTVVLLFAILASAFLVIIMSGCGSDAKEVEEKVEAFLMGKAIHGIWDNCNGDSPNTSTLE